MRPQNINLAYAETIQTCLAIEDGDECVHNPRWIEEDWSEERLHSLQRERRAFEHDPEFYSREQRIELSKRIIHGRVCLYHYHYCAERLHILQMIRGDAKGDLNETATIGVRSGRVRTTAARAARKRAVRAARSLTPEQGRQGGESLRDGFEGAPSSLTDHIESSTTAASSDTNEQRSDLHGLQRSINHAGASSALRPVTPQPTSHQTSLERLILLGHLQESEERLRHLEHDAYVANDEIAQLRHQNAELREYNFQLKLEKVQQDQELIQTQNLLRSAGEQFMSFLAAKNR